MELISFGSATAACLALVALAFALSSRDPWTAIVPFVALVGRRRKCTETSNAEPRNNAVPTPREWKDMYHKLQNLTQYPEVLPEARRLLKALLREGRLIAGFKASKHSILGIQTYRMSALQDFLSAEEKGVMEKWESYSQRRARGSPPDLFRSRDDVRELLKRYAPLNLIDGAWICRIHKITTPFALRHITRHASQTLIEEYGDGDLEKHHIYIYRQLLQTLGVELPPSDDPNFINQDRGMDDPSVWKAALAQLLISLQPNDFLPEILGFNLHFERLSLQTLKLSRELPEFGVNGQYYTLHVSIDNGHSGHSAMAFEIVAQYMAHIEKVYPTQADAIWRRVQSGYLLSEGLDGAETLEVFQRQVANMLKTKAKLSHRIHCGSAARIGKQTLPEWLAAYGHSQDGDSTSEHLGILAAATPWIRKGDSGRSRLIHELSWGGKMYGAFTNSEIHLLRTWIDSCVPDGLDAAQHYTRMVDGLETSDVDDICGSGDLSTSHPVVSHLPSIPLGSHAQGRSFQPKPALRIADAATLALIPLWFTHGCILENVTNSPYRTATQLSCIIIQILRAEHGFTSGLDSVDGIDGVSGKTAPTDLIAIGFSLLRADARPKVQSLRDVLEYHNCPSAVQFCYRLLGWSMQCTGREAFLLGLARAFLDLEIMIMSNTRLLPDGARKALGDMIARKATCFEICIHLLQQDSDRWSQFLHGYDIGREGLNTFFG